MAKTMKFGMIGNLVEIPYPDSGMTFDTNTDTETSELVNGGRYVHYAPVSYRTYGMSWKGKTAGLGPLIDIVSGHYGRGPIYMLDPLVKDQNLLTPRFASSYQLAYLANGWGKPTLVSETTVASSGKAARFNWYSGMPVSGPSEIILIPTDQPIYFRGYAVGPNLSRMCNVSVETRKISDGVWDGTTYALDNASKTIIPTTSVGLYDAVRITLRSTMTTAGDYAIVSAMELTTSPGTGFIYKGGRGTSAMAITSNLSGTLTGSVIDRIGLSLDLTEVQL